MSLDDFYVSAINESFALYSRADADGAIAVLRRAIAHAPDLVHAYRNLGGICNAFGLSGQALEAYWRVLRIAPDDSRAHFNSGKLIANAGDSKRLLDFLIRAVTLDPGNEEFLFFLAYNFYRSEKELFAIVSFVMSLTVNPINTAVLWNLSLILSTRDDPVFWRRVMRNAVTLEPDNAKYYQGFARAIIATGAWDFATTTIRRGEIIDGKPDAEELKGHPVRERMLRSSVFVQRRTPRIYDCFTFFNELDLLDIRLHELADHVDQFVIVEGTRTFSNKAKPLYFEENKQRFADFLDKITYIVLDDYPEQTNAWQYEYLQRNQIAHVLNMAQPQDFILLSDVDEIPRGARIADAVATPEPKIFEQAPQVYYLNCRERCRPFWPGTRLVRAADFTLSPQAVRATKLMRTVPDGGWHFSYLGGVEAIIRKIESYSHQEFNMDDFKNPKRIAKAIRSGSGIFGDGFDVMTLDTSYPEYVLKNEEIFSHLIFN